MSASWKLLKMLPGLRPTSPAEGEEYHQVLSSSFEQRWMDVYENEGKRSGAYSIGSPVHPFVLLIRDHSISISLSATTPSP